jgi:hypothetical protein
MTSYLSQLVSKTPRASTPSRTRNGLRKPLQAGQWISEIIWGVSVQALVQYLGSTDRSKLEARGDW